MRNKNKKSEKNKVFVHWKGYNVETQDAVIKSRKVEKQYAKNILDQMRREGKQPFLGASTH